MCGNDARMRTYLSTCTLRAGVSLALVCGLPLAGCQATLESDLQETQADAVIVALHAQGIGAEKVPIGGTHPGFDVQVAAADVGPALRILREAGLPSTPDPGVHEVFGQGGLVPTATEERARYALALAGELAASLERIDGVLDARVHVALPEQRLALLDDAPPRPRASVLIKHRAGSPPYDVDAVRELVAGALHGMSPADVSVMPVAAAPASASRIALVHVGPIAVTRGSSPMLRGVLLATLALHALLAGLLAWLVTRHRRKVAGLQDELASTRSTLSAFEESEGLQSA